MLTWEEINQFLNEDMVNMQEFPRYLGEIAPQDILTQLGDRVEEARRRDGYPPETAADISAGFMMGFHIGYMLARKGYRRES